MPLVSQTFDQLIDFTRTTAGTFVGSNGLIQNTPASRNLLTFTQEFDNAAWVKLSATVTANATTAPDGTFTADALTASAAASTHRILGNGPVSGSQQAYSIYAKAGTHNYIQINSGASANIFANFDLLAGIVGTVGSSATAAIQSVGDGWYRCSIVATPASVAGMRVVIVTAATAAFDESWTAAGTELVYLWGAQVEVAAAPSTYTRNNGGVYPPRFDYDPLTLAPRGLLIEEQRTNLQLRSEEFDSVAWVKGGTTVVANDTTAPDGALTADKLVEDTSTGLHRLLATYALTLAPHTLSVYAKAAGRDWVVLGNGSDGQRVYFDLANGVVGTAGGGAVGVITALGGGWYRCAVTFTPSATPRTLDILLATSGTTNSYTGDGTSGIYLWGAQLEAGAFATSYIPTVLSQVTRTADTATITGQNFSQWYNQSEGTLVAEWLLTHANATGRYIAQVNSPTVAQGIGLWVNSDGLNTRAWVGATSVTAGNASSSTPNKAALGYRATDNAVSLNGAAAVASSATGPTDGNFFSIGFSGVSQINGHIRRITYYPTRLSNAQLQALTA